MTEQNHGPDYHITPLLPLIEGGFQLLTPNLRLARQIKAGWDRDQAARGARAWRPLAVQPLESWLRQQWWQRCGRDARLRRVVLDQGQALALWRQVIAADQQQGDYQLLQADATASLAQQARNTLLRWQQSVREEGLARELSLDPDCAAFLRWCRAFEDALDNKAQATALDVIALLAAEPACPEQRVALLEFDEVPPLFDHCLRKLCTEVERVQPPAGQATMRARAYPDRGSEFRGLARWVRETAGREPEASIGVVLGDMRGDRARLEYLLRREFDCLDGNYGSLPVNFSTGWPLAEAPVVRDALMALAATGDTLALGELLGLMRSRFLALPDRGGALAQRFITRVFDTGREPVPVATLRGLANQGASADQPGLRIGGILQDLARRRDLRGTAAPSVWAGRFREILGQWGWPGEGGLDSIEYQQVEDFYRLLDTYAGYDAVCGPLHRAAALQLLRQCCRDTVFQPQTADSRIQVLGPLEAAGLRFDHLWVFGMQAGQWPAPARPNPLLPMALQRRLEMPHASAEREWEFSAGLLEQYRRSASRLHASYSRELDGAPELPSALLADFEWVQPETAAAVPEAWLAQWRARDSERLDDHRAPALSPAEKDSVRGGSGLLEDQSQCPFRAFARRRLRVEPLAEPSLALSAGERGSLLHNALFALWGELGDAGQLAALDPPAEGEAVARAVAAALDALPAGRRHAVGHAYCEQEREHLERLLREWLAVERQRGAFVVAAREQGADIVLAGLPIHMRVDRVDRLADGSTVIIDYKSGRSSAGDWLGERPARPQLPLYGLASEAPVAALAFAQLRPRDCKFSGLGQTAAAEGIEVDIPKAVRGRVTAQNWEELREFWRRSLEQLARDFIAGAAAVTPLGPQSCTWCGLQPLCRIDAVEEGAE
ncbi:PD-(D/E)XK nuclease family protein [Parahaliea mediterranea]|uniref:PD-(D/E)XK nuclease family protein n=1 Tax=Parahaliea mediterranea TaxID=651086 RepID=A0A939DGL2_9GAMM|nr:PD-(D/E)XK nuclease family protein [Parahaliea mediterranea]MBN7797694.1 PD-(D/E)XK nuclease family protein [Parahaliea mediterranea]